MSVHVCIRVRGVRGVRLWMFISVILACVFLLHGML